MFQTKIGLLSFVFTIFFASSTFAQSIDEKPDVCNLVTVTPAPNSTIVVYSNQASTISAEFDWFGMNPPINADVWLDTPIGNFCDGSYNSNGVVTNYVCSLHPLISVAGIFVPPTGWYQLNVQISPWKTCKYNYKVKFVWVHGSKDTKR